jgi:hypothetical protein
MEGFLGALVALLLGISIVLYRYCKHLLNKSRQFAENIDDLKGLLQVYSMHLQQTYQAPTFYGDSTLESLLKHTKEIINDIKEFNDAFLVEIPEEKGDNK